MNRSAHKTDDDRGRNADASERWWPSPFGEDDQHGMLNHITDAKRREAPALVREGRFYDLGHILDEHAPVFPGRYFRQTLVTTAHQINADPGEQPPTGLGDNKVNWITVVVAGTMQEGTHIDGLNHLQIGDRCYNGWSVAALAGSAGTKRLGAETIPQIVTRGWLVDVTAVRGVDQLRGGDVITTEDVHRATRAPPWCGRRGQRIYSRKEASHGQTDTSPPRIRGAYARRRSSGARGPHLAARSAQGCGPPR